MQTGEKIDKGFTVGDALGLLLGIDEHQVPGPHPHVDLDMLGIGEVDVAHQVQRLVVVGIESEVLQQEVTAYDSHRVVIESHPNAIGDTHEIGRVDVDFAVDIGVGCRALDLQFAFAVALQTDNLVGHHTVGNGEGHSRHGERGVDDAFSCSRLFLVLIDAAEQSEFLIVEHQSGLNGMGIVFLLQIDQFRTDIADGRAFVGHILNGHIGGYRIALVLILQDMVVAVKPASDLRQIGDYGGNLAQVDAVQAQRQVLQHRGILVLRIELQTCPVVGDEVHLGLYPFAFGDVDEVVLVQVELLIADGRTLGHQSQAQPFVFHLGGGSQSNTHLALGIVVTQSHQGSVLVDVTVEEGIEHELRILLVVADLSLIG